jgi:DNA polymerase-3 subunit beta
VKATVDTKILRQAVRLAAPVASRKSTLPIVTHLKITANGRLEIEATNLEDRLTLPVPAQIEAEGACTVPARWFAKFLRSVSAETVELNLDQWKLNLRADGLTAGIQGKDPLDYPPTPRMVGADRGYVLTVDGGDFRTLARRVMYAASRDEARPVLQGVLFQIEKDQITAATTDGFRIAIAPLSRFTLTHLSGTEPEQPASLILPVKTLENALTRLPLAKGRVLTITWNGDDAQLETDGARLYSFVIGGNFPDYKAILPKGHKIRLLASKSQLLPALRAALIFADDYYRAGKLYLDFSTSRIEIGITNDEIGNLSQSVPVKVELAPEDTKDVFVIGFNLRFLVEALEHLPGETVEVRINANNTPIVLAAGDCLVVVMPLHLGGMSE